MRAARCLCVLLAMAGCAGGDLGSAIVGGGDGKDDGTTATQFYRLRVAWVEVDADDSDYFTDPDPVVCVDEACTQACSNEARCAPPDEGRLSGGSAAIF